MKCSTSADDQDFTNPRKNQLKTMEKKNERIILIPERGLCYHPNWPEEPVEPSPDKFEFKYQYDMAYQVYGSAIRKYYTEDLPKALSEAVLFEDVSKDKLWLMIGEVKQEPAFNAKFYGKVYVKENHPYEIPTEYRIEVRTNWIKDANSNQEADVELAYLLPIEKPKEEFQEELWKEVIYDTKHDINVLKSKFTITRN